MALMASMHDVDTAKTTSRAANERVYETLKSLPTPRRAYNTADMQVMGAIVDEIVRSSVGSTNATLPQVSLRRQQCRYY